MDALPVTFEHARAAGRLPRHHGDPFDRMFVAQALLEGLTLVTTDAELARYGVPILPA
jgi:PIN domain nuclease of toxin-antitoxin system